MLYRVYVSKLIHYAILSVCLSTNTLSLRGVRLKANTLYQSMHIVPKIHVYKTFIYPSINNKHDMGKTSFLHQI